MATIEKRQRNKGVVYKAKVRVKGHPSVSQTFKKLSEAHEWAEETEEALRNGGYIGDDPPGDRDFIGALDRYLVEVTSKKKPNTRDRDNVSEKPLRKFFRGQTLIGISSEQVATYRDKRAKTVSSSTILKELALLSHIYTVANRDWGLQLTNPVTKIRKPTVARGRTRFLSELEAKILLDICCESRNKKLYAYVLLLVHSGMRPSEAAGITWGQVDFKNFIADLTETKTEPRRAPFSKKAAAALLQIQPQNWQPEDWVFLPENVTAYVKKRPNRYFQRSFDNAVRYAELQDFTMHDLRHTAASYLIMAGVDLRTLAEILGHKSMDMVMRYSHLIDSHKTAAVDKIAGLGF